MAYKPVCLSPLQKFTLHVQISTWTPQTLLTVFWQGNLGWWFCYTNACSQSGDRFSQCTWLISCLIGTDKKCFHPTACPVPPTLSCSLSLSPNPAELTMTHALVTRSQSSFSHSGMLQKINLDLLVKLLKADLALFDLICFICSSSGLLQFSLNLNQE